MTYSNDIIINAKHDNLEKDFSEIFKNLEKAKKTNPFNKDEHETKLKSWVAKFFIIAFFSIILILPIVVLFTGLHSLSETFTLKDLLDNMKSIMTLIGGVVGAPLGVVIGYYFKSTK